MKRLAIVLGLALLALGLLGVSSAANVRLAGGLDPSFGNGGVVQAGAGIAGIAVQPDGKIVAASDGSLFRYRDDGSPDASFGIGGVAGIPIGMSADTVALQPDGKIVVAGESEPMSDNVFSEFAVARYNPDGSLDTSFGTSGVTETPFPEPQSYCGNERNDYSAADVRALAILPGGDILAAGWAGLYPTPPPCIWDGEFSFALARYSSTGSLDPTFGDAGLVQTPFSLGDYISGLAVQPDGKIVATGSTQAFFGLPRMDLARYESDGSLDTTFGGGGKVTGPVPVYEGGPTVLEHGKILVAGATKPDSSSFGGTGSGAGPLQYTGDWVPVLARYDASGSPDPSFGKHGIVKIRGHVGQPTNFLGHPTAMVAQKNGKILIAAYPDLLGQSTVFRLQPNGRLDPSFGTRGIVSFGGQVSSLALQTDGDILVGNGGGAGWELARLIGGNNCVVPGLRGKRASKARAALKKSYCRRGHTTRRFSRTVQRGQIISTAPPRGARLPGGAKIELVVSKGKRP